MPALERMRILDMTQYEAGTSCTQALAWLGADVVKVERPGVGDPGRGVARGDGNSPYFLNWNANKRSIALDLQQPEGRELLLQMVPHYDVFVENYGPGVIEKLDIGYDVMREVSPSIIYARLKGFGTSGPYADYKSYDPVAQAAGGAFSVTGFEGKAPTRPGITVGDAGTGLQLALAITAAFVQKQQTGEGQEIEISMQEAMTFFMRTVVANGSDWGRQTAGRRGNEVSAPTDLYPCKPGGSNDYVYIMVVTSRMWDTLCAGIGRPDLISDPRFETGEARRAHSAELHEEIAQWTRQRTKYEAMKELGELGVPISAVLGTHDLFNDPHLTSRDFIQTVEHPLLGSLDLMRWPPRMSKNEVPMKAGPLLGQHTDEVLAGDLELSDEATDALKSSSVIAQYEI
ncbi:MAG: CoA transferase [Dehalococcoidia bacterium]|jgi:formyl-CoA transferase|nr:CoA transferase [Dehalococcoidia bacterium]